MKETGIIMSGNHPKLILEGIKTVTRRVIKPQPVHVEVCGGEAILYKDGDNEIPWKYKVGDRLWVKETWRTSGSLDSLAPCELDRETSPIFYEANGLDNTDPIFDMGKKRVSIFMPRWASRITLEITDIRVERLQEITGEDARAEGYSGLISHSPPHRLATESNHHPIWWFQELWDSLNAKRGHGWKVNPWVWVISFRGVNNGR